MAKKEDYGLPDETLQLIAAAPSIFAGNRYLQPRDNTNTRLPGSALIAALRDDGTGNSGFTQYANRANADSASARTTRRNLFAPNNLTMARGTRNVTLPGAETTVPTTRVPRVLGPLLPVDPDPVDPVAPVDPVDPDPVVPTPVVPDPVVPDPVDPDPVDPDPVDPELTPTELPPFVLDPLLYPQVPTKEKIGTVEITPVDPNEETPQDDGTTQDILDLINAINASLGGAGNGGGKYFDDQSAATLEF